MPFIRKFKKNGKKKNIFFRRPKVRTRIRRKLARKIRLYKSIGGEVKQYTLSFLQGALSNIQLSGAIPQVIIPAFQLTQGTDRDELIGRKARLISVQWHFVWQAKNGSITPTSNQLLTTCEFSVLSNNTKNMNNNDVSGTPQSDVTISLKGGNPYNRYSDYDFITHKYQHVNLSASNAGATGFACNNLNQMDTKGYLKLGWNLTFPIAVSAGIEESKENNVRFVFNVDNTIHPQTLVDVQGWIRVKYIDA